MQRMKIGILMIVGFLLANFFLITPTSTYAAGCSQYSCDGRDSYAMGCAGGSASYRVVAMNWIYDTPDNRPGNTIGYTQLWWSDTCKTNWARTVRTSPYSIFYISANIERIDGRLYWTFGGQGLTAIYTPMVYGYNLKAQACGYLDPNAVYTYHACTVWG